MRTVKEIALVVVRRTDLVVTIPTCGDGAGVGGEANKRERGRAVVREVGRTAVCLSSTICGDGRWVGLDER